MALKDLRKKGKKKGSSTWVGKNTTWVGSDNKIIAPKAGTKEKAGDAVSKHRPEKKSDTLKISERTTGAQRIGRTLAKSAKNIHAWMKKSAAKTRETSEAISPKGRVKISGEATRRTSKALSDRSKAASKKASERIGKFIKGSAKRTKATSDRMRQNSRFTVSIKRKK